MAEKWTIFTIWKDKKRKTVVVESRASNKRINNKFLSEGSLVKGSVEEGDLQGTLAFKRNQTK